MSDTRDHRHDWNATVCGTCGWTRGRESRMRANRLASRKERTRICDLLEERVRAEDVSSYTYGMGPTHHVIEQSRVLALIAAARQEEET